MKALSIKEPYATLIVKGIKKIETRSYKTNYRGPLLIHASKSKVEKDVLANKDLASFYDIDELSYGGIIGKCEIVDCVYMDEKFLEEIKKHKVEYICGDYKLGRYAWILDKVERLEMIPVRGNLGLWNYDFDK